MKPVLPCILIFLSIASVFAATKCYQCSTATKPECADASGVDECTTTLIGDINCVTYKYIFKNKEIIYRGCTIKSDHNRTCEVIKNGLQEQNKKYVDCEVCETDLCNSAPLNGITPIIFFMGVFILFLK